MRAHRVYRSDLPGNSEVVAELDDEPGGLGFLPDGSPIVVLTRKRQILRICNGGLSLHADLNRFPGQFLNDMVVDRQGRAFKGGCSRCRTAVSIARH